MTVVGSAALDTIETPFGRVEETLGGSAFYIGASGSLFSTVHIVAVVGSDFPQDKIEFLRQRGVDMEGLEVLEGSTFRWEGLYHRNINHRDTIFVDLGVFEQFDPELPRSAAEAGYIMLANIDPALQLKVLEQALSPRLVALDSMNYWIEGNRKEVENLLTKVDLFFLNDEELFLLTGENSPVIGARKLLETGLKHVVVKKGEHGAMLFTANETPFICPAFPLASAKDPTGAGDTFAGAMIGYLAATEDTGNFNLRRAVVYGTIAASFAVEEFGMDRLSSINDQALQERFRFFRSMVEF